MEPTLVTETSEVKTQTPGKFPEESTLVCVCGHALLLFALFQPWKKVAFDRDEWAKLLKKARAHRGLSSQW
jgi:hypothetical protein